MGCGLDGADTGGIPPRPRAVAVAPLPAPGAPLGAIPLAAARGPLDTGAPRGAGPPLAAGAPLAGGPLGDGAPLPAAPCIAPGLIRQTTNVNTYH